MSDKPAPKKRNRGVELSAATVRALAKSAGMATFAKFELNMLKAIKVTDGQSNSTASNAWYGKKMERGRAEQVAELLGFGRDFSQLQVPLEPKWVELLQSQSGSERFVEFVASKAKLDLIDFGFQRTEGLDEIPLKTQWRVKLTGQPDEQVFMILRSTDRFYLMAPLDAGADFYNQFDSETMHYPQRAISFNQNDGIGWREIIAIKAKSIPFAPRHPEQGFALDVNELERFTHQLLAQNDHIEVDRYAFVLVS